LRLFPKRIFAGIFSRIVLSDPLASHREIAGRAIGKGEVSNTFGVGVPEVVHAVAVHTEGVDAIAIPVTSCRNIPGYSIPEEYVSCTVIVAIQRLSAIPEYTGPDR
jgi:hypothetical protein